LKLTNALLEYFVDGTLDVERPGLTIQSVSVVLRHLADSNTTCPPYVRLHLEEWIERHLDELIDGLSNGLCLFAICTIVLMQHRAG